MQLMFSIGDLIGDTFGGIWLLLDTIVFGLINSAYKIFMAIASARLLSSDAYYEIANRLYVIVGVVMLFVLSYAILKAIIDPDQATKGDFGSGTIKRVITAVIGLAITPVLFNVLYQAQGLFLEQDVIGKVFFRMDTSDNAGTSGLVSSSGSADAQIKNIGGSMAAVSIWQAFFYPANGKDASEIKVDADEVMAVAAGYSAACAVGVAATVIGWIASEFTFGLSIALGTAASVYLCAHADSDWDAYEQVVDAAKAKDSYDGKISLEDAYTIAAADGSFDVFLAFKEAFQDGDITYKWFISTVCGAFCLYAFASFSIDMGVRAAKLAYYQIIAPIPLIMQVLPKFKDNFHKYVTGVVTTFLEVFIRISVVYIVVYVISHLQELFSTGSSLWANGNLSAPERAFAMALLILGLVIFAKSAPDLITSSLGIPKGSMNLGFRKKLADGGAFSAYALGNAGLQNGLAQARANFNKNKNPLSAIGAGVRGLGRGVGSSVYEQFLRDGHKPAMNFGDVRAQSDAIKRRLDNKYQTAEDNADKLRKAEENLEHAKNAYNSALAGGDPVAINNAENALKEAQEAYFRATRFGRKSEEFAKKIDAWTTISVSLKVEEADIKFAKSAKQLKDDTRAEALKKCIEAQAHEKRMNDYKSRVVSEYKEEWDESSYTEELRRRLATVDAAAISNYRTQVSNDRTAANNALVSAQAALAAAQTLGDQTAIDAAQNDVNVAQAQIADYDRILRSTDEELGDSLRERITEEFKAEAKKTQDELSREYSNIQRQIKIEKDLMEAALDDWVIANAGDVAIQGIVQSFLSSNADYISSNGMRDVFKGQTVNDIIAEFVEPGDNSTYSSNRAKEKRSFEFTDGNDRKTTYTFDDNTKRYVSSNPAEGSMALEELFLHVGRKLSADKSSKFEASTTITRSSKKGKTVAEGIPTTKEFIDKSTRKQMEDSKK